MSDHLVENTSLQDLKYGSDPYSQAQIRSVPDISVIDLIYKLRDQKRTHHARDDDHCCKGEVLEHHELLKQTASKGEIHRAVT